MKGKTGFLKIFITSIYDVNVFSQYAKEGLLKAITYILIVCIGIGIVKGGTLGYRVSRGFSSITNYLQSNEKKVLIKDGLLTLDSNITNTDNHIYLDKDKTINEDIDFKDIFYDNKIDLLLLKDGIAFNNYGSIYAVNYMDIFRDAYVSSNTIITTAHSFSAVIIVVFILLNIIETLTSLVFNYLIVVTAALLVSMFMKMVVKYKALWSIVIYASTMPLIIITLLNLLKPNINFDFTFIGGTFTYVVITLKHIKNEIIQKLSKGRF
ncbi:DUF1189 family protein [uncultured Clostridium sp.]|uniref:DUF1189 family protein n=1 Tax=uncultured Clostridium sp. TaxID=59620 RepID=UPI0025E2E2E3|nr:DUF1189 family protein [uncultured Clostridium sp.]